MVDLPTNADSQDCHGDNHHTHHSSDNQGDEVVLLLCCRGERGEEKRDGEGERRRWVEGRKGKRKGGRGSIHIMSLHLDCHGNLEEF